MPDWKQIVREHLASLRLSPERELEIVEELAQDLEAVYEEALARGATEPEAYERALREIADWRVLECELSRVERPVAARWLNHSLEINAQTEKRRGGMHMESLLQDLRHGLRALGKSPGFTLVAVVALALGIGANTAIFSVVNAVLLRPLPYPDSERLVTVFMAQRMWMFWQAAVNPADFIEWRARQSSFEGMAAYTGGSFNLSGGNSPVHTAATTVSADFFSVLGVQPMLGRGFLAEENQRGRNRVVILSHALWQQQFSADPQVVGRTVKLDGEGYTVVGVMPDNFRFVGELPTDVIVPLELEPNDRRNAFLRVIARLKPGVTREQANAEMESLFARLRQAHPDRSPEAGVRLVPLHELTAVDSRRVLWVLLAAVGFVLLIACANLANLLLARAMIRQREIAVRAALGASRWRLVRQLLTESLMLAGLGGIAGLALAFWGVEALAAIAPRTLPRVNAIRVDWWTLGFTFVISVATGVLFGIAPALQSSKPDLTQALKEGGRVRQSGFRAIGGRFSLRGALVISEVALALVLLAGAGLMLNSFARLMRVERGFAAENVLSLNLQLPETYRTNEQIATFRSQTLDRLRALPGVTAAGAVNQLPLGDMLIRGDFRIEGRPALPEGSLAIKPTISSDYFRAMGIALRRGREFSDRDTAAAPNVAVVSESFARRYFAGEDPIGKRVSIFDDSQRQPIWHEVVGVAGDVKQESLVADVYPAIYTPLAQSSRMFLLRWLHFVVRTDGEPMSLAVAAQREIGQVDPELPMISVKTMSQIVAGSVAEQRFQTVLLGIFAALALVLAVLGIYGVMSYAVAQRTHEIGIRVALGAQVRDVLRLVIGQGMALAIVGVAVGLMASLAATRLIKSMLFNVSATDPWTFASVAALLAGAALVACWIPARRASQVDPMVALREE